MPSFRLRHPGAWLAALVCTFSAGTLPAAAALPLPERAGHPVRPAPPGHHAPVPAPVFPTSPYVALGDSYTAGPLVPNQVVSAGLCQRSDHNYPSLVAAWRTGAQFVDMSCGGATTGDMDNPQRRQNGPAQFDGLNGSVHLVSLGVGANDIGLLDIASTCTALGLIHPTGAPCTDYWHFGGQDRIQAAIDAAAPQIAAVLDGIHRRSPRARILVIGYPDIFPETVAGCWPAVPIAPGDMPYLRSVELSLNRMLATQAAGRGATFVDTYTSSVGHDICQQQGVRWVEWTQPSSGAAPIHPNVMAMENDARQILAALGR